MLIPHVVRHTGRATQDLLLYAIMFKRIRITIKIGIGGNYCVGGGSRRMRAGSMKMGKIATRARLIRGIKNTFKGHDKLRGDAVRKV